MNFSNNTQILNIIKTKTKIGCLKACSENIDCIFSKFNKSSCTFFQSLNSIDILPENNYYIKMSNFICQGKLID